MAFGQPNAFVRDERFVAPLSWLRKPYASMLALIFKGFPKSRCTVIVRRTISCTQ
jgi:hypothetical protein